MQLAETTSATDAMVAAQSEGGAARRRERVMKEKIIMKEREKSET